MPKEVEEIIVGESVLEEAIKFVESEYFVDAISAFKKEHAHKFATVAESKHPEEEEMSLEFTAVFNLYEALIESLFEDFTIKYDTSISSLYSSCRDAAEGKFTALFEEHEHKWFVDMILSWTSFDHFLAQMCDASRRFSSNQRAFRYSKK